MPAGRSGPGGGGQGTGRRLAARMRGRFAVARKRLRASALPIVQCGLAAGLAWLVAFDVFGHERPFFAPIAAVISLGVSLANRLRRAVELVVGVSLGVLVGDLIVSVIGSGWWQIALVVTLAVAAAVFADGGTLLVNQAGASAVLVATLVPPGQVGGLDRCVDALIGGVLGILVAAVIPSDPVAPVRRTSRALLDELAAVLRGTADALRDRDADAALAALQRARRTQPLIDSLRGALHGGREVTTVSPLLRRRRRVLARYGDLAERADYAMRNARVVARRAYAALLDGEPPVPDLPDVLAELACAVDRLTAELNREGDLTRARAGIVDVVAHAKVMSAQIESDTGAAALLGHSEQVLVAQIRSIALGLSRAEARTAMS
jgi:uncharacterized membrane protein YgaE (UPF0421/DUF939 family)